MHTYTTANITVAPSSMTALLYKLANFTCEGIGDKLLWSVQGNSPVDPSNQDREISVTTNNISVDVWSSVLTIRALPINDGITVGCTVLDQNLDFASEGATLTVKGKLSCILDYEINSLYICRYHISRKCSLYF